MAPFAANLSRAEDLAAYFASRPNELVQAR